MMRTAAFVAAFILSALEAFTLPVTVEAPDDLWPFWERLLQAAPLPPGVEAVRAPAGAPASPRGTGADAIALEVLLSGQAAPPDAKVIGSIPLVPVAPLGEQRRVSSAEVRNGAARVEPLSGVALPEVALPVDGLYPDQQAYPFHDNVLLRLKSSDENLRAWFERLPHLPTEIDWIGAVGDVMPARGVDSELLSPGGIERVFGDTLPVLQGFDILLGNLESSAASDGAPARKTYTFRFRPRAVEKLRGAGFTWLSLTNNHTFDFGPTGFRETLAALSRWGVRTSGAGRDLDEASRACVLRAGSLEVRILSFGAYPVERTGFNGRVVARATPSRPGILWLDGDGLAAASRAFSPGALNIAFVHGGREWSARPVAEQVRLYRELIRRGANVVIGAHPHVLQELEAFEGGLIAYSLGNFLFPGMEGTPGGEDSAILKLGVYDGAVRFVQLLPVRLKGGTVRMAGDERAPASGAWEH